MSMSHDKAQRQRVALAFGASLRSARLARGISQEQLAFTGGFDRTYPSMLERGLRTPTLTVILRLAEAIGIDPIQLFVNAVVRVRGGPEPRCLYLITHKGPEGPVWYEHLIHKSLDAATSEAVWLNESNRRLNLPVFTHVAEYVEARLIEVPPVSTERKS